MLHIASDSTPPQPMRVTACFSAGAGSRLYWSTLDYCAESQGIQFYIENAVSIALLVAVDGRQQRFVVDPRENGGIEAFGSVLRFSMAEARLGPKVRLSYFYTRRRFKRLVLGDAFREVVFQKCPADLQQHPISLYGEIHIRVDSAALALRNPREGFYAIQFKNITIYIELQSRDGYEYQSRKRILIGATCEGSDEYSVDFDAYFGRQDNRADKSKEDSSSQVGNARKVPADSLYPDARSNYNQHLLRKTHFYAAKRSAGEKTRQPKQIIARPANRPVNEATHQAVKAGRDPKDSILNILVPQETGFPGRQADIHHKQASGSPHSAENSAAAHGAVQGETHTGAAADSAHGSESNDFDVPSQHLSRCSSRAVPPSLSNARSARRPRSAQRAPPLCSRCSNSSVPNMKKPLQLLSNLEVSSKPAAARNGPVMLRAAEGTTLAPKTSGLGAKELKQAAPGTDNSADTQAQGGSKNGKTIAKENPKKARQVEKDTDKVSSDQQPPDKEQQLLKNSIANLYQEQSNAYEAYRNQLRGRQSTVERQHK